MNEGGVLWQVNDLAATKKTHSNHLIKGGNKLWKKENQKMWVLAILMRLLK